MTEEEFHRARRMFVLMGKGVHYAPPNDPRSHDRWFKATFKPEFHENWMRNYVRGFVDSRGVFLYIQTDASDFDVTPKVVEAAKQIAWSLHTFRDELNLGVPDGTPIYGGVVQGGPGEPWPPKVDLGVLVGPVV